MTDTFTLKTVAATISSWDKFIKNAATHIVWIKRTTDPKLPRSEQVVTLSGGSPDVYLKIEVRRLAGALLAEGILILDELARHGVSHTLISTPDLFVLSTLEEYTDSHTATPVFTQELHRRHPVTANPNTSAATDNGDNNENQ